MNTTQLDSYAIIAHMSYFITTRNGERRKHWQRIFETDRLPVLHREPRYQEVPDSSVLMAYDLDLSAFHSFARRRLAAHVARRSGRAYGDVLAQVITAVSWPIDANDCDAADLDRERPFFISTYQLWSAYA